jgi:hypothetical protein
MVVGDFLRPAARDWHGVKMSIIGADEQGFAVRRDDVVVVEIFKLTETPAAIFDEAFCKAYG